MPKANFTVREVLDQLDDDARKQAPFFPDFDHGYHYHIDGRLSVYGDADRWVVIIEQLGVNPRAGTGADMASLNLYFHGSSIILPEQAGWGDKSVLSIRPLADGPSGELIEPFTEKVNLSATNVVIRGRVIDIRADPNYYWARKIDAFGPTREQIDEWIANAERCDDPELARKSIAMYEEMRSSIGVFNPSLEHLLRGMVPEWRGLLLSTDKERLLGVPSDLPQLLQMNEWDHPRLTDGELPSQCESFRLVSKVLATRDPTLYKPTEPSNTHWSNWPLSGSL